MIDLNHRGINEKINYLIDSACIARRDKQTPRDYLGGSRLGHPCSRFLQFEFLNVKKDEGQDFPGRTIRIFDLGHNMEDLLVSWLRESGFTLLTEDPETGGQFGFEWGDNAEIKGHVDGVLTGGPDIIKYPCLFEAKSSNLKKFRELEKKTLRVANPTYFSQVILYQFFLGLTDNPALHVTVCKDNCEIYCESVTYDPKLFQTLIDKGSTIVQACKSGDLLPAIAADPSTAFDCKWCCYRVRCAQFPTHGIIA